MHNLTDMTNIYMYKIDLVLRIQPTEIQYIDDAEGKTQVTLTTCYEAGKGWVLAKDLAPSDRLVNGDNEAVKLTSISTETLDQPVKVYNFEVANAHTYYVSSETILVHNDCRQVPKNQASKLGKNIEKVNPSEIRFSQTSVNGSDEIIASMKANGWKGDPIDVVTMPDGSLTTLDNTRVAAAREVGIDVQANVRSYDTPLPDQATIDRFTTKKGVPKTWGEAIELRVGKQKADFRNNNPMGSFDLEKMK